MRRFITCAFLVALTGCVPPMVLMRGPSGDLVRCEASSGSVMVGGYIGGSASVQSCVEAYQGAGYRPVEPPREGP